MSSPPIAVAEASIDDRAAILSLASRALGWANDERDRAFFAWKHEENPFGPSPAWVATLDDEIVGFRTMLRWEFSGIEGVTRCVRAVDTATDPEHQGLGVFRALTLRAVDSLVADGVGAVFNTPNAQSRPGYLNMGWSDLGRPPLTVVPRGPGSMARMVRSRSGAEKWSEPTTVGLPALQLLDEISQHHLDLVAPVGKQWTVRTPTYLRWRYGFEPLRYRALEVRGGWCIFRVRRRGPSVEVAVCEWLSPEPDPRALRKLVHAAGDYAVGVGLPAWCNLAMRLPSRGPSVTWRPLARPETPRLSDIAFTLGDLELF